MPPSNDFSSRIDLARAVKLSVADDPGEIKSSLSSDDEWIEARRRAQARIRERHIRLNGKVGLVVAIFSDGDLLVDLNFEGDSDIVRVRATEVSAVSYDRDVLEGPR